MGPNDDTLYAYYAYFEENDPGLEGPSWTDLFGDECEDARFNAREYYKNIAKDKKEHKERPTKEADGA